MRLTNSRENQIINKRVPWMVALVAERTLIASIKEPAKQALPTNHQNEYH